jgi:hypothetical protein
MFNLSEPQHLLAAMNYKIVHAGYNTPTSDRFQYPLLHCAECNVAGGESIKTHKT